MDTASIDSAAIAMLRQTRRLRPKPDHALVASTVLKHERLAFIYQRLSTHEQKIQSVWSLKMQDALHELAKQDGYPDELICMEKRDLGISGTLGPEKREGLARLIQLVETNKVESVYVVHTSRLYRDQTLIDAFSLAELLKRHGVIIVMPNMRLNLNDKMQMRIFRLELERAADELEMMNLRLGGARRMKAAQGLYVGSPVPAGYVVDLASGRYVPYTPHAEIVRSVFRTVLEEKGSSMRAMAKLRGVVFPFYPPELSYMSTRTSLKRTPKLADGYAVTPALIDSIVSNPVYVGWWVWGGEIVKQGNHEPIIDEELMWEVQRMRMKVSKPRGKAAYQQPMLLTGLLFCANHEHHQRIWGFRNTGQYECVAEYHQGKGRRCFDISARYLDEPIGRFVVSQCSFPEHCERVIEKLESEYEQVVAQTKSYRRDYDRLTEQIETLKENLAHTKGQEQVSLIMEMIGRKTAERAALVKLDGQPEGQALTSEQIQMVRGFLTNLEQGWHRLSPALRNEFLNIVLDRVEIAHTRDRIDAIIKWKTGKIQRLLIHRPVVNHRGDRHWTSDEDTTLKNHYGKLTEQEILRLIPGRTWSAIEGRAVRLRLHRERNSGYERNAWRPWSSDEDERLRKMWESGVPAREIADSWDRTMEAIMQRAALKGYQRPVGWKSETRKGRVAWEVERPDNFVPSYASSSGR